MISLDRVLLSRVNLQPDEDWHYWRCCAFTHHMSWRYCAKRQWVIDAAAFDLFAIAIGRELVLPTVLPEENRLIIKARPREHLKTQFHPTVQIMARKFSKTEIVKLIDKLKTESYTSADEILSQLTVCFAVEDANIELLLAALRCPDPLIRAAAVHGCRERQNHDLMDELRKLVTDPITNIRLALASILGTLSDLDCQTMLAVLARDIKRDVRKAAIEASAGRAFAFDTQSDRLGWDEDHEIRGAAAKAMATQKLPHIMRNLVHAFVKDGNTTVRKTCGELIEQKLTEDLAVHTEHMPQESSSLEQAHKMLKTYGLHKFPTFAKYLESKRTTEVNIDELEDFGTSLTVLAKKNKLPRAFGVEKHVQDAVRLICCEPRRSVALLGPSGVGKTAIVNELVYELAKPENGDWHVLRISPNEFLTGTKYIGEWNTKLAEIINLVRQPRKVILYIPNFSELSGVGRYDKSETNVASALSTYIEEGSIVLIGESTSEEYAQGLGSVPSLDRLFSKINIEEATEAETRQILKYVRKGCAAAIPTRLLDEVFELGQQYLHHIGAPGNCVSLLRDVIATQQNLGQNLTRRMILETISKSTGIPSDFLDESIPLDLEKTRTFLEERVMGQHEGVEAVIDLISCIKAGITDTNKPFGIFLFVGPTGVGKTEMARSLAEFVFGNVDRLKRFDMSEFATYDSYERLIGARYHKGLLTEAVRRNPLSVVLLDEIEKAHINVFDICLQIFDAGRLTDGLGRTIDFRSSIVILTSNVGFNSSGTVVGFDKASPDESRTSASALESDRIFKELSRVFRPEFLNRVDRIINFNPIGRDIAAKIAAREVSAILKRSGIRRKNLSIEMDPSLIELLLKEGYSKSYGARPLKRAVERVLVQPLARVIASGSVHHDCTLKITANGNSISFEEIPRHKRR